MMLAEPAARRASRQHIWKALFALSVALNLFFVVGALWIRVHAPAPTASAEDRFEQMAGELGLNAQHPPRVGVHPVAGPETVQQPLVGCGALHLAAAQDHRAAVAFGGVPSGLVIHAQTLMGAAGRPGARLAGPP